MCIRDSIGSEGLLNISKRCKNIVLAKFSGEEFPDLSSSKIEQLSIESVSHSIEIPLEFLPSTLRSFKYEAYLNEVYLNFQGDFVEVRRGEERAAAEKFLGSAIALRQE